MRKILFYLTYVACSLFCSVFATRAATVTPSGISYQSSPSIRNNIIEYCLYGAEIYCSSSTSTSAFRPSRPIISSNNIRNCSAAPLNQASYSFPQYSGSAFSGNGVNGIAVSGILECPSAQTETWDDYQETGLPYWASDFKVSTNATLAIRAGTVIKVSYQKIPSEEIPAERSNS